MKKLLCVLTIVFAISKISFSQEISFCKYIDKIWGKWEKAYIYNVKAVDDCLIIYCTLYHPSEYIMKIKLDDDSDDKKSKKAHRRSGGWYEYTGTVEYFTYNYDAKYSKFNIKKWPSESVKADGNVWDKKYITSNKRDAIIKLHKSGYCLTLNIYFDNIGIGISICSNEYL